LSRPGTIKGKESVKGGGSTTEESLAVWSPSLAPNFRLCGREKKKMGGGGGGGGGKKTNKIGD